MTSLIETRTQQAFEFINQGGNFIQFVGDEQKRLTALRSKVELTSVDSLYNAPLKQIQFESIDPAIDYFTLVQKSEECVANQVNSSVKSNLKLISSCYKNKFDHGSQVPSGFSLEQRQALLLVEARQGEELDQAVSLLADQAGIDLEKAAHQVYNALGVGSFDSMIRGGIIGLFGNCFFFIVGFIVDTETMLGTALPGRVISLFSLSPFTLPKLLVLSAGGVLLGALIGYGIYQLRKDNISLEAKKKEILEHY